MTLVIDNYDSFTYNLVQYLGELNEEQKVVRNDAVSLEDIRRMTPSAIVISPGPCTPKEAGISVDVIKSFGPEIPILGVCLGHQSIGAAYGGSVVRAPEIVHGKTSKIHHTGRGIFVGIPSPFNATRYHSLIVDRNTMPHDLEVTAWTENGIVMGVQHKRFRVFGVQFHPESIATEFGKDLLKNFLSIRG
ncbi:MAG: anthranilate/aminodeoxychorismate synthase component II [Ignavibacteria bacterium GWA2_55_11]|nr:MAG: anthranilate/aminodeoxychorismate synthase component II [Ignavibacteria bacterium GWA2_55_11]OGU47522.1 MAG: anthranilate/aminodeoxychorismate synthase component II [Ignavibacteria bacterium GWC2_56_12]OGU72682.1 MAG: anthranilate/aminodeoxychorismate synthase component II [Ignavibacteria bacterium RIFCSPLOWO2_02_FULL_55_14]OGU73446.1 MAG: anthranilate/aminodeoxychorismate synthase component II [Ignavibacteria bacterium RIFCSPLOWO2_12_FULL_56_21]